MQSRCLFILSHPIVGGVATAVALSIAESALGCHCWCFLYRFASLFPDAFRLPALCFRLCRLLISAFRLWRLSRFLLSFLPAFCSRVCSRLCSLLCRRSVLVFAPLRSHLCLCSASFCA